MKILFRILGITVMLGLAWSAEKAVQPSNQGTNDFKATTEGTAQSLKRSLDAYRVITGACPTLKQGLRVLVDSPHRVAPNEPIPDRWRQILEELPNDAWGNSFLYLIEKVNGLATYELRSLGEDGKKSDDDIVVKWTMKPTDDV